MFFFNKNKKNIGQGKIIIGKEGYSKYTVGYDRLKDNILCLNADGNNKVIQIESSVAHEGKTTVVCNLAVSLGLTHKKVLVVDLDFIRPKVHRLFGLKKETGVTDYILSDAKLPDIIKRTQYSNVDVITRGAKIYNSSLVLISDKFKELVQMLREKYEYILLDCAPVLQVSDYIHISKVSDGVLFLAAHGSTTRGQVSEAIKELKFNGANLLGSVFTMYNRKNDSSYYRGARYYKYNSYIEDHILDAEDYE